MTHVVADKSLPPVNVHQLLVGISFLVLIVGSVALFAGVDWEPYIVDVATPLTNGFDWLARDVTIFGQQLSIVTRDFAAIIGYPLTALRGILADGFSIYRIGEPTIVIPPIPWFAVLGLTVLVVSRLAGIALGAVAGAILIYAGLFDLWQSTMQTIAAVAVSVSATVLLGLWLGIAAYRSPWLSKALDVVFDIMQTIPVFAYLVPLLVFFGFGPATALIATITFAMPPMARVTALALKEVPEEIKEFACVTGSSRRQTMWWVLLPAAHRKLLVGVNQSILFTLAMVIIASVIGAGGLGSDVLNALRGLRVGDAISAGLAITFIAILLDRVLQKASTQGIHPERSSSWVRSHIVMLIAVGMTLGLWAVALFANPNLAVWPSWLTVNDGQFWNSAVAWLNATYGENLIAIRNATITWVLRPLKDLLLAAPWPTTVIVLGAIGWCLSGWRLALGSALTFAVIALTGYWDRAMVSLYLVLIAAAISGLVGVPLGLWAGTNPRVYHGVRAGIDVLQTLPTFVYLIPVVVVFGVGDVAALLAIVLFAVAPVIRYTAEGIRQTPGTLIEVAQMSGARAWQTLWLVRLPTAAPQVVLGLNQTLLMSFNMLVITSLVGTRGLEQTTLQSIVRLNPGEGLAAGLALSGMAIVLSRMLTAASSSLSRHSLQRDGS